MNIHRESVVDGNQTLVLGLIWAIIHHYQVKCASVKPVVPGRLLVRH